MADIKIGNFYAELSLTSPKLAKNKNDALKELEDLEKQSAELMKSAGDKMTRELQIKIKKLEENKEQVKAKLQEIEKDATKISDNMKQLGEMWVANVTKPLVDFGIASIETFSQFEQSMQNTFSVMGATESEMQLLSETAQKMGETTRFSASQAAQALYSLGSAGQSATEASKSLQGVLRLAGATGADLAYSSETITSTLSQFNLQAGKASHVADVFAKAISKSQANIVKLSYSMKYVGPVASGLGISLETTTAALMKLYNTGYGGEQAGTYLRQAFQKLASGTEDFKKKLSDLGIAYEDVNPQTRNFADILNTLKDHNVGVTEAIAIFGETAGGAMAKLIDEGGDAIRTFDGILQSSEGAAEEMQKIQNTSFANTKAELASAFEALQISIGSILIPAVDYMAKGLTKVLQVVNSLPVGVKTFITGLLVAGAALGPLLLLPKMIGAARVAMQRLNTTMLQNPIFLAGAVIATVAAAAYALYRQVEANTKELADQAKRNMNELQAIAQKATEAGEKAKTIDALLAKYDSLHNKTNKTKEEQEEYNQTLHRLVELVPDVVTSIDETGQAFIDNLDKIKYARNQQLLLEEQQNKLLIDKAKNQQVADNILKERLLREKKEYETPYYGEAMSGIEVARGWIKEAEKLQEEFNNAMKKRGKTKEDFLNKHADVFRFPWQSQEENVLEKIRKKYEEGQRVTDGYNKIREQLHEIEARGIELDNLLLKDAQIQGAKETLEGKKAVSKKKVIDDALREGENEAKAEKARTQSVIKNQVEIQRRTIDAELKVLKDYMLNKLHKMQKDIDITEDFSWDLVKGIFTDEDLKRLQAKIHILQDQLDKVGGGPSIKTPKPQEQEKKSLDDELQKLDSDYQTKLEIAKKYGHDEFSIGVEWHKKRDELLEQEIAKIEKLGKTREEALKKTTGGKDGRDGITIGDELKKTGEIAKLWQGEITKARTEYEEKQEEFKIAMEELARLKELQAKDAGDFVLTQKVEETQEKAKRLAGELKIAYMTQKDLDELTASFDTKREATFIDNIKDIKTKEKNAIQNIQSSYGLDDKQKKKAIDEIVKKSEYATAVVSTQLIQSIGNVGNNFTNMLLNAIETSEDGLDASMKIITGMMAQVQDLIPEPITKAVIGSILAVYNIIDSIVNYSKKKEEERRKKAAEAREKALKKESDRAKEIAGDSAKEYARHISASFRSGNISKNLLDANFDKMLSNKVDSVLNKMGEAETDLQKWVKSGHWEKQYNWGKAKYEDVYVDTSKYEAKTMNDLWKDYFEARRKGDDKEAELIEKSIKRNQKRLLKEAGLREEDINGLHKYLKDVEGMYTQAIQSRDLSTIGVSFKERVRNAIVDKIKNEMFEYKIKKLVNKFENNPNEESLSELIEEADKSAKKYEERLKNLTGALGVANSEMDEHIKAWASMKNAITESLSSSLGDAAYNADWASFKKAFAGEMRKAIISATVANAKVKTQIDSLIKTIMADGKITESEIDNAIKQLQDVYDDVEGKLAPFAKITQALEKGVDVKSETKGSVIQKLSGADRDWFTEVLREGFENMVKAFNFASVSFKEIHASQIIIQQATLSVSTVNIYAKDNYTLKDLIAEMIREAQSNAG